MLFFAFWYAYSYYRSTSEAHGASTAVDDVHRDRLPPLPPARSRSTSTTRPSATGWRPGRRPRSASAGSRSRPCRNDPLARQVVGTAEVRYGRTGAPGGKVVAALVKGAKAVQDARVDGSVDLVLGEKFTALAPVPKPAAKPAASKPAASKPAATKPAATKPAATTATSQAGGHRLLTGC